MKKNILFVCTGNTCRSPLAEYLLRHKAGDQYAVQSAGIAAGTGFPASEHVDKLLLEKGISNEHQSQALTEELINWADLILTMTVQHQELVKQRFPAKANAVHTLKEYSSTDSSHPDIFDPFGGPESIYRLTMEEIDALLDKLIKK
ncbi:low molecular weight protein arginine phosphatase [Bacillus horti]|uniref:Protein-tyrosine phosphatase n=1 Tax=Caldalkalibacillus horti TaxID=77523 RepID=A0ABT9VVZ6_9BACI|nr:low molecular weight protein arginine phosphatase [Bacillus horti]MDQ0165147.1 protein-tyrosine phosphatase [Bacillus horti]